MAGFEVEGVERAGAHLSGVVVGEVLEARAHRAARTCAWPSSATPTRNASRLRRANLPALGGKAAYAPPGARSARSPSRRGSWAASSRTACSARKRPGHRRRHGRAVAPAGRHTRRREPRRGARPGRPHPRVNVTPNRPDGLGHVGIARELGAIFRRPVRLPEPPPFARAPREAEVAVRVEDPPAVRATAGRCARPARRAVALGAALPPAPAGRARGLQPGRCHQRGAAALLPAVARLRPGAGARERDRRPPRARRRDDGHPGRDRAPLRARRPPDLRRRGTGRRGGRDGRAVQRDPRRHGGRADRVRALRPALDPPHLQAARALLGVVVPLRARDRPRRRAAGAGLRRRTDGRAGRRSGVRRRDRCWRRRARSVPVRLRPARVAHRGSRLRRGRDPRDADAWARRRRRPRARWTFSRPAGDPT